MVNNRRKVLFTLLILLSCGLSLFGQEKKFTQKLSWKSDKNAFEYSVDIKSADGKYSNTIKTDLNYVELTLPAGDYKYRVSAYDFLGRKSSSSEWQSFKILKAVAPKVKTAEKEIVPDKDESHISITVDVASIEEDSKVVLVNKETKEEVEGSLEFASDNEAGVSASKAVFPQVSQGEWVIKVTNPSGLSTESESINVAAAKSESERRAEEERLAAERRAEEERLAAERRAEEERLAAERRAEEERLAAERRAEEERLAAERRAEEERLAAERKAEEERLAAERRAEEERLAAERRAEEERLAAERRAEEERLAAERRAEEERLAAERRAEEERLAAELKEAKANKPAADFTLLFGGGALFNVMQSQDFITIVKEGNSKVMLNLFPSAEIRIGWLPFKNQQWKFGSEIAVIGGYGFIENELIRADFPVLLNQINLVMQKNLASQKLFLSFKAGGSIIIVTESTRNPQTSKFFDFENIKGIAAPGVQGGLSFVLIPAKKFQMELGADFNYLFIKDYPIGTINTYFVMGVRL